MDTADIVAVDDLTFTIEAGEIFGLVGANGAGKSATIMALAGLLPVRSGRAMMAEPSLLLIDELSLGLMPIAVDECYRALSDLQVDGLAILLVEQSTERVLHTADRIAILESGRLAWTGRGSDAIGDSTVVDAILGLSEM